MAMGDPWILGNVVFPWPFFGPPPCPVIDFSGMYGQSPKPNFSEATLRKAMQDLWAEQSCPCGYDERDAKV